MGDMSVQDVKTSINKVTDESLVSTRWMLQMLEESQEQGKTTMMVLDKQGEQLINAEENVNEIQENMKIAQRNLNKLSGGWFNLNRLKSIKNNQRYKEVRSTDKRDGDVVPSNVTAVHNSQEVSPGPYIKRITNDAREDEMEENLEQVGGIIENLKKMARDMGNELDKQNKTIDRITDKVEITTGHVKASTKKANKLIKK